MLMLDRNHGEAVMIGDDIKITVIKKRGQIVLGIDAPKNIPVHREEVYDRIHREQGETK